MEQSSLKVNTDVRTGAQLLKEDFCLLLWFWESIWMDIFAQFLLVSLLPDTMTKIMTRVTFWIWLSLGHAIAAHSFARFYYVC